MPDRITMTRTATIRSCQLFMGTNTAAYRANTVAIAAMMPECMLQIIAQPQRKPTAGDHDSLRNTYTPPVSGYADASSAQISAPQSVSAPAAIHTNRMPATDGIWRVISDGCTKIDAPMIVPTTIAVAWVRPRERRRVPVIERRTRGPLGSWAAMVPEAGPFGEPPGHPGRGAASSRWQ